MFLFRKIKFCRPYSSISSSLLSPYHLEGNFRLILKRYGVIKEKNIGRTFGEFKVRFPILVVFELKYDWLRLRFPNMSLL